MRTLKTYSKGAPFYNASASGKLRERGADALGMVCPKTPLPPRSQVTDSVWPEFPVLDAHKHMIVGLGQLMGWSAADLQKLKSAVTRKHPINWLLRGMRSQVPEPW